MLNKNSSYSSFSTLLGVDMKDIFSKLSIWGLAR